MARKKKTFHPGKSKKSLKKSARMIESNNRAIKKILENVKTTME
jgi:hypothetical protein